MLFSMRWWYVWLALLLAACQPAGSTVVPAAWPSPQPWPTRTPHPTVAPPTPRHPVPTVTPTPRQYVVQTGDTLIGIAAQLGLSLDDLLLANPGIIPSSLAPGDVLVIPSGESPALPAQLAGVRILQVACHGQADGSTLCLALVRNESEQPLEDISLRLTLTRPDGSQKQLSAFLLLDALFPGMEAPASFLTEGNWTDAAIEAEVFTAFPFDETAGRYAPATLQQVRSWGGKQSIFVEARPAAPAVAGTWQSLWVAAWAYDLDGHLVAARRLVWNAEEVDDVISLNLFSAAEKPVSGQVVGLWAQFSCPFCP